MSALKSPYQLAQEEDAHAAGIMALFAAGLGVIVGLMMGLGVAWTFY